MNALRAFPLLAAVAASGCMTGPRPVNHPPRDYLSANQPNQVWVTLNDGEQLVVTGLRVITDTVFGWSVDGSQELMIAVSDIREVQARRISVVRSAIIPATLVLGGIAAYLFVSNDGTQAGLSQNDCADAELDPEDCPIP